MSRLAEVDGDLPAKKKFKACPTGFFQIFIAEVQTAEGRLHRFAAIDRTRKFGFVALHRTTRPQHPWSHEDQKTIRGIVFLNGGQLERMNRTIKDATVKRFPYDAHDQLRSHLADFLSAYNFGRRLKTLKGLTPDEFICKCWTSQPERFTLNPLHQMPGLNS